MIFVFCLFIIICAGDNAFEGFGFNAITVIKDVEIHNIKPRFDSDVILLSCNTSSTLPPGLIFVTNKCSIEGIPTEITLNQIVKVSFITTKKSFDETISITVMEEELQPKILYKTYPGKIECGTNLFKDMSIDSYPEIVEKTGYVDELFFEIDSPNWSVFEIDTVIQFSGYIHLIRAGSYIFYIDTNNEYKMILDNVNEVESTKCENTYYNVTVNVTSSGYVPFVLFYHYTSASTLTNYLKVIFSSNIYPRMIPIDRFFNIPQFPRYLQYPDLKLNILLNRPIKYEPYIQNTIPSSEYSIDNLLPDGLSLSLENGIISGTPTITSDVKQYTIKATNRYGSTSYSFTLQIMDNFPNGLLTKYYEIPSLKCGNIPNIEDITIDPSIILVEDNINHINNDNLYERWSNIALYDNYLTLWEGRLSFPKEGKWLILIKANDEADVYINDILIISKKSCGSFNEEYLSYELYVDKLMLIVDIKVVYIQLNGAHGIGLYWRNNDNILTVIPSSAFLYYPTYSFDYKYEKIIYRFNVTIPNNVPELFGIKNIKEFRITPDLPIGFNIDKNTGIISGKTVEIIDEKYYTVECVTSTMTISTALTITVLENELPYFAFQNDEGNVITTLDVTVGLVLPPITIIKYNSINYFDSPNLLTGLSINAITGTINGTILDLEYDSFELQVCAHSITGDNCIELHLNIETCSKNGFIFRLNKNDVLLNNTMLLIITGPDGSELFRKSEENTIYDNNYLICTTANGLHTLDISNPKKGNYKYSIEYLSGEIIDSGEIEEISNTISFTIGKSVLSISYSKGEIVSMIYEFVSTEPLIYGYYTSLSIDKSLPFGLSFYPNGTISGIPTMGQPRLAYIISICNKLTCAVTRVTFTIKGCNKDTNSFYFTYYQISGPKETIKLEDLSTNTALFNILDSTNSFSKSFCGSRGNYQLSFYTTAISTPSLFVVKDDKDNIIMNYIHEKRSNSQLQFSTMFLIEANSHWNYIYVGSEDEFEKNWMIQDYDDYSWNIGTDLIYPEIYKDEISQYYRRTFEYNNNNDNNENGLLDIGIKMNSCFIVYINGLNVHKFNIDDSDLKYNTKCLSDSYNSNKDYKIFHIPSSYLMKGINTIAVEIHQSPNPSSYENIFDLHMSLLIGSDVFRSGIFTITSSVIQSTDKDDASIIINDEYNSVYYTDVEKPKFCLSRPDKQYETINHYVIYTGSGYSDSVPKSWKFYGTNKEEVDCTSWNEDDWILLDEKNNEVLAESTKYDYDINNVKPYFKYAFEFTDTKGSVDGVSLSYIQLYTKYKEINNEYCIEIGWGICYENEYCYGKCPDSYDGYTTRKCERLSSVLSLSGSDLTKCIPLGPITFKYNKNEYTFDIDDEIEPIIPEYNVIEKGKFTISPDISKIGLIFDENTGKITGKSTKSSIDTYTIIYSNLGGSLVNYITIIIDQKNKCNPPSDDLSWGYSKPNTTAKIPCPTGYSGYLSRNCLDSNPPKYGDIVSDCITDKPQSFSYVSSNFVLFKGVYTDSIIPQYVGANIKFEKVTELPQGLSLNENTGIISGTPKDISASSKYTIKMSNDGGYLETTITLIVQVIPKFKYDKNDFFLELNKPYTFTVTKENEFDSSFDITDDLPTGFEFDRTDGKFTIDPQLKPLYFGTTIETSFYGYTATFYVAFHVVGSLDDNYYDVDEIIFVSNSKNNLDYPLKYPFYVSECQVTPSLPYGFTLSDECTIGGNPSELQGTTVYTVIMNNPFEIKTVTIKLSVVDNIANYKSKIGAFRYRVYNNPNLGCNFAIKDYNHKAHTAQQFPKVINHAKSLAGAANNYYEVIEFLLTVDTAYDLWIFRIEGDNSVGIKIDEDAFETESVCQEEVELEVKKRMFKGTHHIYIHHYRNTYSGSRLLSLYYSNSKTKKTLLQGDFIYPQITPYDIKYDSDSFTSYVETKFIFNSKNYFIDPIYTITPELPDGVVMSSTTGSMSGVPTIFTDSIDYTIRVKSYYLITKKIVTIEVFRHLPFIMRKQYFLIDDPSKEFVYDPEKYPEPIAQDFNYDYNFSFPYESQGADGYPVEMSQALGVHISSVIHINKGGVRWSFEFWTTGGFNVFVLSSEYFRGQLGNTTVQYIDKFFFTIEENRENLYWDYAFDITMPAGYKFFKYTISLVTKNNVFINYVDDRVYGDIEGDMTYQRNPVTYPINTLINRNSLVYKKTAPYNCSLTPDSPLLPTGLVISSINGDLYGTATETKPKTNYKVLCYSKSGAVETTLTLTVVVGKAPTNVVLYDCQNRPTNELVLYVGSQPCTYRVTADNSPQAFTISPSIPTGVIVKENTGVIAGSPPSLVSEQTMQISATNFYGSGAIDIKYSVKNWPGTSHSFTISLEIYGKSALSHYKLEDISQNIILADQDIPAGSYSFIIKTNSNDFKISLTAGDNTLSGSVIRDDSYILNIEEDAFETPTTVVTRQFTWNTGVPEPYYHITGRKFFYYKLNTKIVLYPSPGCFITNHRKLIAASGVEESKGIYTASARSSCELLLLADKMTSNTDVSANVVVDCELCKPSSRNIVKTRVNLQTTSGTVTAIVYDGSFSNNIINVTISTIMTSICFENDYAIFEYEEESSVVVNYYGIGGYLIYSGSPYDKYHVIDKNTIPQYSKLMYFQGNPPSDWKDLGFNDDSWIQSSFTDYDMPNGNVKVYIRKKFTVPSDCLGGYIGFVMKGIVYIDGVQVYSKTPGWPLPWASVPIPYDIITKPNTEHVIAIQWAGDNTAGTIKLMVDVIVHFEFAHSDISKDGVNYYISGLRRNFPILASSQIYDYDPYTSYSGTPNNLKFTYTFTSTRPQYVNGIKFIGGKTQTYYGFRLLDENDNLLARMNSIVFENQLSEVRMLSDFSVTSFKNKAVSLIVSGTPNTILVSGIELLAFKQNDSCSFDSGWIKTPVNSYAYRLCEFMLIDRKGHQKRKCNNNKVWDNALAVDCYVCGDDKSKIFISYSLEEGESFTVKQGSTPLNLNKYEDENYTSVCYSDTSSDSLTITLSNIVMKPWNINSYIQIETLSKTALYRTTLYEAGSKTFVFALPLRGVHEDYYYRNDEQTTNDWITSTSINASPWTKGSLLNTKNTLTTTYIRFDFTVPTDLKYIVLTVFYQDGYVIYLDGIEFEKVNLDDGYTYTSEATNTYDLPQVKRYTLDPSTLTVGNNVKVAIEYHKKERGDLDDRVLFDSVIFIAKDNEDYTIRSFSGNSDPSEYLPIFERDDIGYNGSCDPLPSIKYTFTNPQYITHYEFQTGDLEDGTLNRWKIKGIKENGDEILLHYVSFYRIKSNTNYKFSLQTPGVYTSIVIDVLGCDNNLFELKYIHYLSGSLSNDCAADTIWYRTPKGYSSQYLCSTFLFNTEGVATRKCKNDGTWDIIDYTECKKCNSGTTKYYVKKSYLTKENCVNEKFNIKNVLDNNNILCQSNNNTYTSFCMSDTIQNADLILSSGNNKAWNYGSYVSIHDESFFPIIESTFDKSYIGSNKENTFPSLYQKYSSKWDYASNEGSGEYIYPFYRFNTPGELKLTRKFTVSKSNIRQIIANVITNGGYKFLLNGNEIVSNNYPLTSSDKYSTNDCDGIKTYTHNFPMDYLIDNADNTIEISYYTCHNMPLTQLYGAFDSNLIIYTVGRYLINRLKNDTYEYVFDSRKDTIYQSLCVQNVKIPYIFYNSQNHVINTYSLYFDGEPGFNSWSLSSELSDGSVVTIDTKNQYALIINGYYEFLVDNPGSYSNIIFTITKCTSNYFTISDISYYNSETTSTCEAKGHWEAALSGSTLQNSCSDLLLYKTGSEKVTCETTGFSDTDYSECKICGNDESRVYITKLGEDSNEYYTISYNGNEVYKMDSNEYTMCLKSSSSLDVYTLKLLTKNNDENGWSSSSYLQIVPFNDESVLFSRTLYKTKEATYRLTPPIIPQITKWQYYTSDLSGVSDWMTSTTNPSNWKETPNFFELLNEVGVTTYLRKQFTVKSVKNLLYLNIDYSYKDGIIIYINDKEIIRRNLDNNGVGYTTEANSHSLQPTIENIDINPEKYLTDGVNYISIEYHKSKNRANTYTAVPFTLSIYGDIVIDSFELPSKDFITSKSGNDFIIYFKFLHLYTLEELRITNNYDDDLLLSNIEIISEEEGVNKTSQVFYSVYIPKSETNNLLFKETIHTKLLTVIFHNFTNSEDKLLFHIYSYVSTSKFCGDSGIWIKSSPNTKQYRSCMSNLLDRDGYESRICNINGEWSSVDNSECKVCNNQVKIYYWFNVSESSSVKNGFILKQSGNTLFTSSLYNEKTEIFNYICISDTTKPITIECVTDPSNRSWNEKTILQLETIGGLIISRSSYDGVNDKTRYLILPPKLDTMKWKYSDSSSIVVTDWLSSSFDLSSWSEGSYETIKSTKSTIYLTKTIDIKLSENHNLMIEFYYYDSFSVYINHYLLENHNMNKHSNEISVYRMSIPFSYVTEGKNRINVIYSKNEYNYNDYLLFDLKILLDYSNSLSYYSTTGTATLAVDSRVDTIYTTTCKISVEITSMFTNNLPHHIYGYTIRGSKFNFNSWSIYDIAGKLFDTQNNYALSTTSENTFLFSQTVFANSLIFSIRNCGGNEISLSDIMYNIVSSNSICLQDNIWHNTASGSSVSLPCAYGLYNKEGEQTRKCVDNNNVIEWEDVDYSKCRICSNSKKSIKLYISLTCSVDCKSLNIVDDSNKLEELYKDLNEESITAERCYEINKEITVKISSSIVQNISLDIDTIGGNPLLSTKLEMKVSEENILTFVTPYSGLNEEIKYYITDPSDPNWKTLNYDDKSWSKCSYPNCLNTEITTYYRSTFSINNLDILYNVIIEVYYNEGFIFNVNGEEILRENLPTTNVDSTTEATSSTTSSFPDTMAFSIPLNILKSGDNIISVEYHKASSGTSYTAFDFMIYIINGPEKSIRTLTGNSNYLTLFNPNIINTKDELKCSFDSLSINYYFYSQIAEPINYYKIILGENKAHYPKYWKVEVYDGNRYTVVHEVSNYQYIGDSNELSFYLDTPISGSSYRITFNDCNDDELLPIAHIEFIIALSSEACQFQDYWSTTPRGSQASLTCLIGFKDKEKYQTRKCNEVNDKSEWDNIVDSNCDKCTASQSKIYIIKYNKEHPEEETLKINANTITWTSDDVNKTTTQSICLNIGVVTLQLSDNGINDNNKGWDEGSYVEIQTFTGFVLFRGSVSKGKSISKQYNIIIPIYPLGGIWKYNDVDLSSVSNWYNKDYNDGNWKSSNVLSSESITVYLRRKFSLTFTKMKSLQLSILAIGGYIIYFNNQLVGIYGVDTTANYNTFSTTTSYPSENKIYSIDPNLILNGDNYIGIEFHKEDLTSNLIQFDLEVIYDKSSLEIIPSFTSTYYDYCDNNEDSYFFYPGFPYNIKLEYPNPQYFNAIKLISGPTIAGICEIIISGFDDKIVLYNDNNYYIDANNTQIISLTNTYQYKTIQIRIVKCENQLSIAEFNILYKLINVKCSKDEIWPETIIDTKATIPCSKLYYSSYGLLSRECEYDSLTNTGKWSSTIDSSKCNICDNNNNNNNEEQIEIEMKELNENETFVIRETSGKTIIYNKENINNHNPYFCIDKTKTYELELAEKNDNLWKTDSFISLKNSIDSYLVYKSYSVSNLNKFTFSGSIISRFSKWSYTDNVQGNDVNWKISISNTGSTWKEQNAPYFISGSLTTYFRKEFQITDRNVIGGLFIRLYSSDGIIVYLNGNLIYKYNMIDGGYWLNTMYANEKSELLPHDIFTDNQYIKDGSNIIAVEFHKSHENENNKIIIFDILLTVAELNPNEYIYENIIPSDSNNNMKCTNGMKYYFENSNPPIIVNLIRFNSNNESLSTGISYAKLYGYDTTDLNNRIEILELTKELQPDTSGSFVILIHEFYKHFELEIIECNDDENDGYIIPPSAIQLIYSSKQWCDSTYDLPTIYKNQSVLLSSTTQGNCPIGYNGIAARQCNIDMTWSTELSQKECKMIPPLLHYNEINQGYYGYEFELKPDNSDDVKFVATMTINPELPTGLKSNNNYEITGIPTNITNCVKYEISFVNEVGKFSQNITICINGKPTEGKLDDITWFINTPMSFTPTTDYYIEEYLIRPELPSNLKINSKTGEISGQSDTMFYQIPYLIIAKNRLGSINLPFTITLVNGPSYMIYEPDHYIFYVGRNYETSKPSYTGIITKYIVDNLPPGLSISENTGVISGIAESKTTEELELKIIGSNPAGETSTTIFLSIEDRYCLADGDWPITSPGIWVNITCPLYYNGYYFRLCVDSVTPEWGEIVDKCSLIKPKDFSYKIENMFYYKQPINPIQPIIYGIIEEYEIDPPLPNNLILSKISGIISGTPLEIGKTSHLITARNSEGETSTKIELEISYYECEADKEWPVTKIDEEVILSCGKDKYGTMTRECISSSIGNDIKAEWGPVNDLDCLSTNLSLSSEQAYIYTTFSLNISSEVIDENEKMIKSDNNNIKNVTFSPTDQRYLVSCLAKVVGVSSRDLVIQSYQINNNGSTITIKLRWLIDKSKVDDNRIKIPIYLYTPLFQDYIKSKTKFFDFSTLDIKSKSFYINEDSNEASKTVSIVVYCLIFGILFIVIGSVYGYLQWKKKHPKGDANEIKESTDI